MLASAFLIAAPLTFAQETENFVFPTEAIDSITDQIDLSQEATDGATATSEAVASAAARVEEQAIQKIKKEDVTQPENPQERDEILQLFEKRKISEVNFSNFFAYAVQHAVSVGVPANTIFLILLLPLLATLVAFVRHVIGFPTLGLYVPIALSITLVATGVTAGMTLLVSILVASMFARFFLKRLQIMQLPKVALSMFVVALFIFGTLLGAAQLGLLVVKQLSIFPVLLLILLSERVVELQLERTLKETVVITGVTCLLGIMGFALLTNSAIQSTVLLYPELVLLLVPANILIGRYFGLRLTEYYRFTPLRNASK